jgi:hypothetical protein
MQMKRKKNKIKMYPQQRRRKQRRKQLSQTAQKTIVANSAEN